LTISTNLESGVFAECNDYGCNLVYRKSIAQTTFQENLIGVAVRVYKGRRKTLQYCGC
jgi:hypothetical protein